MKGICFIEPLHNKTVKKIKIQTRRIVNPQPLEIVCSTIIDNELLFETRDENDVSVFLKPRYNIGEILYLKEPYIDDSDMVFTAYPIHETLTNNGGTTLYQYGNNTSIFDSIYGNKVKWKNKLFMPAFAARHFIKITSVRAEKLQEISNEDCIKEGIVFDGLVYMNGLDNIQYLEPRAAYKALINSINGKDTWDSNPWVWVYDYELVDRKEVQQ